LKEERESQVKGKNQLSRKVLMSRGARTFNPGETKKGYRKKEGRLGGEKEVHHN